MEQMEELVDKMVKLQEESEKNYIKLEEKMLEMEERRQKDNQEFMMRMVSFMCSPPMPQPSAPHTPYSFHPMYNSFSHSEQDS